VAERFRSGDAESSDFVPEALAFVVAKVRTNLNRFPDQSPESTRDGRYQFAKNGGWVGGFWTGLIFISKEITGDESLIEAARVSRQQYVARLLGHHETLDHDMGFLFVPSLVADYRLTGNAEARTLALQAAELLAGRFNPRGRFIQAWNVWKPIRPFSLENRGRIIVDSLCNMPLLYWATEESGDRRFAEIATHHVETCLKHLVRDDFSIFHTFLFDPDSGTPKGGRNHQGYADDSWWSRGQAWAISGFAHAYRYTRDGEFLEAAKACAAAYFSQVEADTIPRWDFRVPQPESHPLDTSAAAIAACGLLEIGRQDKDASEVCDGLARTSLRRLWLDYATRDDPDDEGLLRHACGHFPDGRALDASLIYGDYYFAEALTRLAGISRGYW